MNPAKRQRLNEAASVLSKPFRSPLKVTRDHRSPSAQRPEDDTKRQKPLDNRLKLRHSDGEHLSNQLTIDSRNQSISMEAPSSEPILFDHEQTSTPIDDTTALKKEYASLVQQLRQRRQDLSMLQQALNIRSTNQEEKLSCLITKWQSIARDAADDLYQSASLQVKEMGGVQPWHQISARNQTSEWYDDNTEAVSRRGRASTIVADTFDDTQEDDVDTSSKATVICQDEEQHFNMDVMLRQLNIDPDLLGFDLETEQWRN